MKDSRIPDYLAHMLEAATLVGMDPPPAAKNIELKPYGISKLTSDLTRTPQVNDQGKITGGIDAKYGISANMTADLTVNTDFAQVEADDELGTGPGHGREPTSPHRQSRPPTRAGC